MTNKGNFLISILILLLGAVFIWCYDRATLPQYVVTLCGLAFVIPAVISLLSVFVFNRKGSSSAIQKVIQMVCGVGGLGMGLIIILFPEAFKPLLVYPFAMLIAIGGLFQVFQLSHKYRPVDYPGWLLVGPILLIICGVVMICLPLFKEGQNSSVLVLVTGICAVVYGVTGLLISILGRTLPALVRPERKAEAADKGVVEESKPAAVEEEKPAAEEAHTSAASEPSKAEETSSHHEEPMQEP